jgi:hypothetical protein
VKQAALLYDRYHPSSVQLDAFEAQSMPPHVFREQLKRCFNIRLAPQEFGALLSYFDKDKTGTVDCVRFLVTFFRTGQSSRLTDRPRMIHRVHVDRHTLPAISLG